MSDPRYAPWPEEELKLDGGAWRLDPFTRVLRWVPTPGVANGRAEPEPISPDCGTNKGYSDHIRRKEPTCAACRAAHAADRLLRLRASGSRPRRALQPCGTRAAYQRHLKQRTPPCDECLAAERAHSRARRAERMAA